jgi:hypothetical protein
LDEVVESDGEGNVEDGENESKKKKEKKRKISMDKEIEQEKKKEKEKVKQKRTEDAKSILMSLTSTLLSYKDGEQGSSGVVPAPLHSSQLLLLLSYLSFIHTFGLTIFSFLELLIAFPLRNDAAGTSIQRLMPQLIQISVRYYNHIYIFILIVYFNIAVGCSSYSIGTSIGIVKFN